MESAGWQTNELSARMNEWNEWMNQSNQRIHKRHVNMYMITAGQYIIKALSHTIALAETPSWAIKSPSSLACFFTVTELSPIVFTCFSMFLLPSVMFDPHERFIKVLCQNQSSQGPNNPRHRYRWSRQCSWFYSCVLMVLGFQPAVNDVLKIVLM